MDSLLSSLSVFLTMLFPLVSENLASFGKKTGSSIPFDALYVVDLSKEVWVVSPSSLTSNPIDFVGVITFAFLTENLDGEDSLLMETEKRQ